MAGASTSNHMLKTLLTSVSMGPTKPGKTDKPLLKFMKDLVNYIDNEEKTTVTNAQLMDILQKDFQKNIWQLHPLEQQIYMCVLKKYLHSWPQWDTIDLYVQQAKTNPTVNIDEILVNEYETLKVYLKEKLEIARDLSKDAINKIPEPPKETSKCVLQISCTRKQLNNLILSAPEPASVNAIFNVDKTLIPSKISSFSLSYEQLANWPHLKIEIFTSHFHLVRHNNFQYKHTLVNKKLKIPTIPPVITQDILFRRKDMRGKRYYKRQILQFLQQLIESFTRQKLRTYLFLLEAFQKDIQKAPPEIFKSNEYKYFLSKYPYVRNLAMKTENTHQDLDLCIEEYISPAVEFSVLQFQNPKEARKNDGNVANVQILNGKQWVIMTCCACDEKFEAMGFEACFWSTKQHIIENHYDEPDCQCIHCEKTFTMLEVTSQRWSHIC